MKLIDKDALVAEIDKLKGKVDDGSSYCNGWQHALRMLELSLNTLEVKEVQEEPVSEKKCMFTKDNYTDENRMVLCEDCKERCEYSKKEESVSEDLEEACEQLAENARKHKAETSSPFFSQTDYIQGVMDGAKWQKKKDLETIETAIHHAYYNGRSEMKEQMMEKAIDANCFGFQGAALFSFRLPSDNYLVGSKVKVIVIKED